MTRKDVLAELKRILSRYETHKEAALSLKVSPQYLSDVLNGRREPGPTLLKAMKLRRVESYERI